MLHDFNGIVLLGLTRSTSVVTALVALLRRGAFDERDCLRNTQIRAPRLRSATAAIRKTGFPSEGLRGTPRAVCARRHTLRGLCSIVPSLESVLRILCSVQTSPPTVY